MLVWLAVGAIGLRGQTTVTSTTFPTNQNSLVQNPGTITTSGNVIVPASASVTFQSASQIVLTQGFQVQPGGTFTANIAVGGLTQNVSINPTSVSASVGSPVSFTASGGATSYQWGGGLTSGTGNSQTITFSSPGLYTVNVYATAGGGWAQSNIAVASVTVEQSPNGLAPVITSPTLATGITNNSFAYYITATNSPTSYGVTGTLPPGMNVNATTGLISGTANSTGTWTVSISATNSVGMGSQTLTISVISAQSTSFNGTGEGPTQLNIHIPDAPGGIL